MLKIFVVQCYPRNIFNIELFPNYGICIYVFSRVSSSGIYIDSHITVIELMVEFTSGQFIGSESSGFIEVIVRITGGSSSTPITVTVTPSVQSPVSAMGK